MNNFQFGLLTKAVHLLPAPPITADSGLYRRSGLKKTQALFGGEFGEGFGDAVLGKTIVVE